MPDRTVYRSKQPKIKRKHWRDYSDANWHGYPSVPSAASLHPDARMVEDYVMGDTKAGAILDAWNPSTMWQSLIKVEAIP